MFNDIKETNTQCLPFINQDETKNNLNNKYLPLETIYKIFSYLNVFELVRSQRLNQSLKIAASNKDLWENSIIPEIIGKAQWNKYFGDIGKIPPLPKNIEEILESSCPFFPEKKVKETHMLVLIPETIDGKPLTLATLGEFVKAPKEGYATQYRNIWKAITQKYGQATPTAHWVLMTKNVIEGSRDKNYTDQQALIAEYSKKTGINYEVPTALDASICIFMHYISSGERLFTDKPWTYTRCFEDIEGHNIVVGGFSPAGLDVSRNPLAYDPVGVAAMRKL